MTIDFGSVDFPMLGELIVNLFLDTLVRPAIALRAAFGVPALLATVLVRAELAAVLVPSAPLAPTILVTTLPGLASAVPILAATLSIFAAALAATVLSTLLAAAELSTRTFAARPLIFAPVTAFLSVIVSVPSLRPILARTGLPIGALVAVAFFFPAAISLLALSALAASALPLLALPAIGALL